ncbi:family 16 glycoside hydrolase [Negadavirga shengliensis]|uniref:Family 16 glycoside hydrolase n=1 Tax=Negadavirga shengliensis TaxID=1389218 RepID=A0ABV9TA49_9BACT
MKILKLFTYLSLIFGLYTVGKAQSSEDWQTLRLGKQTFELHNVTGEIVKFQGKKVLKIERDLAALPFDANRLEETVDEPHYARFLDLDDFENGTIEVKMYSKLQDPLPYPPAAGFIGVYFRIKEDDSAFESIYLRPKVGRINNQYARNHAVQYFSYPDYKFQTLRDNFPAGTYEGSAPVALDEWITMRIEVNGASAEMFVNDLKYSSFVVDKMLGKTKMGFVGLYVDIGTIGYFRDLKVTKRALKVKQEAGGKIDAI